jgi:hypothetical protein
MASWMRIRTDCEKFGLLWRLNFNWGLLHMCELCMEIIIFSVRECRSDVLTCCTCTLESSVSHCVLPGSWQTHITGKISRATCSFLVLIKNTGFSFMQTTFIYHSRRMYIILFLPICWYKIGKLVTCHFSCNQHEFCRFSTFSCASIFVWNRHRN